MQGPLEYDDIQAFVFTGYGHLRLARYAFFEVREPGPVKAWLGWLADQVKTESKRQEEKGEASAGEGERGKDRPARTALHVAFTAPGLRALGLDADVMDTFPEEFVQGMAHSERSRVLGDTGSSAPKHWQFGKSQDGVPDKQGQCHIVLMLFTEDDKQDSASWKPCFAPGCDEPEAHGLKVVFVQDVRLCRDERKRFKEPFGFNDGISQPRIEGHELPSTQGVSIKPGEVLLGYVNAYGQKPQSPAVPAELDVLKLLPEATPGRKDLGRNGTYMVIRKLWQDTKGFQDFLKAKGGDNPERQAWLAARLVGRWPSGAPLALCPEKDDEELGADRSRNNCFGYANDPRGMMCPLGSHVRRANPRDGLIPGEPGTSLTVVARHQLIRRGRSYLEGEGREDDMKQGLFFVALNADLQRQFEFIQHTWLNNPKFAGQYEGSDPIAGDNPEGKSGTGPGVMTLPGFPVSARIEGLTRFVHVRGGGYFFLPGLRALRFLSQLK